MNIPHNPEYWINELFHSVMSGNCDALKSFLFRNKDISVSFLNQALHHCLNNFNKISGHFQCIKELLDHGANLNAQDYHGITPLMIACFKGNLGLMKFLIEKGADINIKDSNKRNALYYTINNESSNDYSEICLVLLNSGSEINNEANDGMTPLWNAIEKQQIKVVQALCDKDVAVNVANKISGDTPLHLAVSLKNKQIIKILMEKFAKTDKKNKKSLTPYDLAKDDTELYEFMKKLDLKQKTSEQDEIINSLGNNNNNRNIVGDSGLKLNNNNNPRQHLKLTNYNLSPTHLSPRIYKENLKSEKSESNSETLNPFELEMFPTNNPQQHQNFPLNSKPLVATSPPPYHNYPIAQQDSIINHLSTTTCFSPPTINMTNQMNPALINYSFSDNSFNNQHNQNNPRYSKKNPNKKSFQTRDNNKKPSNFQPGLTQNPHKSYNSGTSSYESYNDPLQNNFVQSFNNQGNPPGMHLHKPHLHHNSGGSGYMMNNNYSQPDKDQAFQYRGFINKNDETKIIEQNEELRMEIMALDRQLNGLNLEESELCNDSQEILENESCKEVITEVSIEDSQRSYFLEKASLQKKITLFLPSDIIAKDLHREICEFEKIINLYQLESLQKFQNFLPVLKGLIQEISKIEPDITIFGSFDTGLALPYSDIDIAINLKVTYPIEELLIQKICENFKKRKEAIIEWKRHHSNNMQINSQKIEVTFPKEVFDLRLNLTFLEYQKFSGFKYVKLIKHYLSEMRPLRHLILIIKEFIYRSKLSNIHKGGMNSYSLLLMIIAYLQHKITDEAMDISSIDSPVFGTLLIDFFYHYGFDYDYIFKEIIVGMPLNFSDDKPQQPQQSLLEAHESNPKLVIADPLKRHINVGRTAPIVKIKGAFCLAYMVLHQNYKSNACFCKGENNEKSEDFCCCIFERLFTCTHQTGLFKKNNQ